MPNTRSHRALMQPSSPSSSSEDNDDHVPPPSMHESLRDGLEEEDDEVELKNLETPDNDSQATLLEDVCLGEEQAHLLDKGGLAGDSSRKIQKARRARSNTKEPRQLELKLEQSSLRKRRRRSSSKRSQMPQIERLFLGLRPPTALLLLIPAAIILLVLSMLFTSRHTGPNRPPQPTLLSNGTHWFNNTVIIVSFDGFKPAYLNRELTPHLVEVSEKGLRAEYMRSIFPTLTFPNHWTIQTGLYAESHGIVGNDFWDPSDNTDFYFTRDDTSKDPKWWWGEPIWETVVKNGLKSASIMWPGPPILRSGIYPTYHRPFQNNVSWREKSDQIATWLDMPDEQRPQFICAYLPEIDQQGHHYGPDSDEVNETLREMDQFSQSIHTILSSRNLLEIVNVIYVSDHGMAETSNERIVYLDEVLGKDGFEGIEHKEGWPSAGLRFKPGVNETLMVERMRKGAEDSNGGYAYYDHATMPEEWHFSNTERIAPHFLVPKVGWAITDKTEGWYESQGRYTPYGNHGYDRNHEDMHAIFVAHGPMANRIKATLKRKRNVQSRYSTQSKVSARDISKHEAITVIPGFDNLEIYNLVTNRLLKLNNVARQNGTVGFWDAYLDD